MRRGVGTGGFASIGSAMTAGSSISETTIAQARDLSELCFSGSTEIVGVSLYFHPDRRRWNEVMVEAVFLAIADRCFLRGEVDAHLRVGVPRPVPACQRIRPLRLLSFKFQQPVSCIRLARLRSLAFEFGDAGDGHAQ